MVFFSEALIEAIQAPGVEWLTTFWVAVTRLGGFYIIPLLIGIIYYAVDKKAGFWIGLLVSLSTFLNVFLKSLIQIPRPGFSEVGERTARVEELQIGADHGILPGVASSGPGIPSGHSQGATVFWGSFALELKKLVPLFLIVLPLMVGFSRMYLGVHYLADVLAGLSIGYIFLYLSYKFRDRFQEFFSDLSLRWRILTPLVVFSMLGALVYNFNPEMSILMGLATGWVIGYVIENKRVGFRPQEFSPIRRVLNPVIVGLLLAPFGLAIEFLDISFESSLTVLSTTGFFILAGILGIFFTLIFPWILENTKKIG